MYQQELFAIDRKMYEFVQQELASAGLKTNLRKGNRKRKQQTEYFWRFVSEVTIVS